MAGAKILAWLERIVWILIYGGLLALVLGLAEKSRSDAVGWSLIVGGFAVTAIGIVLIWVRSRLQPPLKGKHE